MSNPPAHSGIDEAQVANSQALDLFPIFFLLPCKPSQGVVSSFRGFTPVHLPGIWTKGNHFFLIQSELSS